ncbi:hypothetical protein [Spongiimicrobium sp. 3-5]|uniref:hypothetical protein n=1 Tax=Spongiimicrobium sp. 3-5 TaxID=3332596 RepID=UPI00397FE5D4
MQDHFSLSDEEFETQFANRTLNPKFFSHEAHLRLAWIHIKKYGLETSITHLCTQIPAYAESLGAGDKFNKTVTVAATKAVYHFMQKTNAGNFSDFIVQFPRLQYNFKELMDAHYGINIFALEQAKHMFLEPDRLPFD